MIGRKTAALIAASIEAGALLATDDDDGHRALSRASAGRSASRSSSTTTCSGIWGAEQATGKEPSDVAHHKKTLPVIYALEHGGPEDRARLRALYADSRPDRGRRRRDRRDPRADRRPRVHPRRGPPLPRRGPRRARGRGRRLAGRPRAPRTDHRRRSSAPDRPIAATRPGDSGLAVGLVLGVVPLADDEHLADAPAVGRLDGEPQAVDLDLVARLGDAADAVVDEPADRVVLVLVLELEGGVEELRAGRRPRPARRPAPRRPTAGRSSAPRRRTRPGSRRRSPRAGPRS